MECHEIVFFNVIISPCWIWITINIIPHWLTIVLYFLGNIQQGYFYFKCILEWWYIIVRLFRILFYPIRCLHIYEVLLILILHQLINILSIMQLHIFIKFHCCVMKGMIVVEAVPFILRLGIINTLAIKVVRIIIIYVIVYWSQVLLGIFRIFLYFSLYLFKTIV